MSVEWFWGSAVSVRRSADLEQRDIRFRWQAILAAKSAGPRISGGRGARVLSFPVTLFHSSCSSPVRPRGPRLLIPRALLPVHRRAGSASARPCARGREPCRRRGQPSTPVPKKISARCAPLIADPVSCAIISRRNGLRPPFSIQTGAPRGTKLGSTAILRMVVIDRFIAPNGPLSAGTWLTSRKKT